MVFYEFKAKGEREEESEFLDRSDPFFKEMNTKW